MQRFIVHQNIRRFREQLDHRLEDGQRKMLEQLLTAEERKLEELDRRQPQTAADVGLDGGQCRRMPLISTIGACGPRFAPRAP